MRQGMYINYEYCTGCHSCETACKKEKGLSEGQFGIKVFENGPWQMDSGKWQYDYIPVPTDVCDLCSSRQAEGKMPACVQHCQAQVMAVGDLEELMTLANEKPKRVVYTK